MHHTHTSTAPSTTFNCGFSSSGRKTAGVHALRCLSACPKCNARALLRKIQCTRSQFYGALIVNGPFLQVLWRPRPRIRGCRAWHRAWAQICQLFESPTLGSYHVRLLPHAAIRPCYGIMPCFGPPGHWSCRAQGQSPAPTRFSGAGRLQLSTLAQSSWPCVKSLASNCCTFPVAPSAASLTRTCRRRDLL
jgi:hypothetical protein